MSWVYRQKTGQLLHDDQLVGHGYSGHDLCRDQPDAQNLQGLGPIPQGYWTISGPPEDTSTHGPFVLHLTPFIGTETFGRSGFLVHGDSKESPGTASRGCIIMPRPVREQVWASGDRTLWVVSGVAPAQGVA